jgi:hypothetical protein
MYQRLNLILLGIVTTLQGITQSYGGLIACRFILGALEAGYFPGMSFSTPYSLSRELIEDVRRHLFDFYVL